jgi:hypothetical protein
MESLNKNPFCSHNKHLNFTLTLTLIDNGYTNKCAPTQKGRLSLCNRQSDGILRHISSHTTHRHSMKSKACLAPSRVNAVRVTGTLLVLLLPLVFYSNVTYADYTAVIERDCHYTSTGACFRTGHKSRGHHPEAEDWWWEAGPPTLGRSVIAPWMSDSTTARRRRRHGLLRQGNAEKKNTQQKKMIM